ncbi:IS5/IS1182 family transposase, partial [Staphylococcus haemolyticus]
LNIRKVVAQRAENNQKIYKKDNFYIISIEIVFFSLIQELYVPDSLIFKLKVSITFYSH